MWGWIGIAILYLAGMGLFHWLGGLGAASDAIQGWGRATANRRRAASNPHGERDELSRSGS